MCIKIKCVYFHFNLIFSLACLLQFLKCYLTALFLVSRHLLHSQWYFSLPFSPTSRAPGVCHPCLASSVPSGPLKMMSMTTAALSALPLSIQPRWRAKQSYVSRNVTRDLTHSVPTWTWIYGLQQLIGMQTSLFLGTRVIVETCEKKNVIFKMWT